MKTNKLAVYGTLRNGNRDTWKVDGFSLVFPGHRIYPAAMIDSNAKDMVVEVVDVVVEVNGSIVSSDPPQNEKNIITTAIFFIVSFY